MFTKNLKNKVNPESLLSVAVAPPHMFFSKAPPRKQFFLYQVLSVKVGGGVDGGGSTEEHVGVRTVAEVTEIGNQNSGGEDG